MTYINVGARMVDTHEDIPSKKRLKELLADPETAAEVEFYSTELLTAHADKVWRGSELTEKNGIGDATLSVCLPNPYKDRRTHAMVKVTPKSIQVK